MTTCLLLMAAAMGCAADDEDVVYTRERAFRIPLELSDAERKSAAWVRLMVSTDGGKTWNRVREESPKRPTVTFRAPGDGQYWLALAVVGHDEKMHPSNPADLKPGLKVVIDSSKPEAVLEAVKTRSGLRGVRWTVKDNSPENKMAMKCAVWDERVKAWKPRSLSDCRNNTIWFARSESIGKMQLLVADAAGNETVEQIDIDGDRFLCAAQDAFALSARAPTPTQFAESAKPRVESRTLAEIEQASHKAMEEADAAAKQTKKPEASSALADASPLPKTTKATAAAPTDADVPLPKEPPPMKKAAPESVAKKAEQPKSTKKASDEEVADPVVKKEPPKKSRAVETTAVETKPAKKPDAEAEMDVSYSNRRTTVLHYEMTSVPKGEAVELWGTLNSKEWIRLGRDEDGQSPMEAMFPSDGRWGVTLVVGDAAGSGRPSKDDAPSTWVEVDTKRPKVMITGVHQHKNGVRVSWKATDVNLVDDSARLFYARDPAGPWETIAVQQAGDGEYLWRADDEALIKPVYFRVDATDAAGNIGSATTSKPYRKGTDLDESETTGVDKAPKPSATKTAPDAPTKEE